MIRTVAPMRPSVRNVRDLYIQSLSLHDVGLFDDADAAFERAEAMRIQLAAMHRRRAEKAFQVAAWCAVVALCAWFWLAVLR